jgi:hypothetical protein
MSLKELFRCECVHFASTLIVTIGIRSDVRLSNGTGDEISMAEDEVFMAIRSSFEWIKTVAVDALQRGGYVLLDYP